MGGNHTDNWCTNVCDVVKLLLKTTASSNALQGIPLTLSFTEA
jgi:hypothetical protein